MPGELPWLHPTQRPGEPITSGLPRGPGPGPEAYTGIGALAFGQLNEQGSAANLLRSLANQPGASSEVKLLAAQAGAR
jgi:hypothetical protein